MKDYLVYLMGLFYVVAGVNHFRNPRFYIKMMKGFLPYAVQLNYISGVAEIILGIGVCIPATRSLSAIGLIILLIAIFPANLNMALQADQWRINPWLLYARLPLQLLLIYWAYVYVKR